MVGLKIGKEMVGKSIKKIGIVLGQEEREETADRYKGFEDAIDKFMQVHDITWIKVKGHADNEYNNRCDELAVGAIKTL